MSVWNWSCNAGRLEAMDECCEVREIPFEPTAGPPRGPLDQRLNVPRRERRGYPRQLDRVEECAQNVPFTSALVIIPEHSSACRQNDL
jgi:hypothetical protein